MKLTDLRGILQYIPRFREKVFVLSLDGAIVAHENFTNILLDIAVLRSLNIRVVLVHGAGAQIQALAEQRKVTPSDLEGCGLTDSGTLNLALAAANHVTHEVMEGLASNDLRAAWANAVIAHPVGIIQGVDQRFTGKVERVDVDLLRILIQSGIIPVVPPLGFDGDGKTFRVNSDAVAVAIAEALKAAKLIFMTTQDGLVWQDELVHQMQVDELTDILDRRKHELAPEGVSKAIHAAAACRAGVSRVHIINGRVDDGLLAEVFSNEGIGTLVHASEYQQIRRALKKDIRSILRLIKTSVATAELAKRTRATIEKQLGDYYMFEIDRNPAACVALHPYPEQRKGELACLYVDPSHENQGIGRKLVSFVEKKAQELGFDELILMSTQSFSYFQSKGGFVEGTLEDLPPSRREKYAQSGRNSKVLVKKLARATSVKPKRSIG